MPKANGNLQSGFMFGLLGSVTTNQTQGNKLDALKNIFSSKLLWASLALSAAGASAYLYRSKKLAPKDPSNDVDNPVQPEPKHSTLFSPVSSIDAINHYLQALVSSDKSSTASKRADAETQISHTANDLKDAETQTLSSGLIAAAASPIGSQDLMNDSRAHSPINSDSSKLTGYDDTDHHLGDQAPLPQSHEKIELLIDVNTNTAPEPKAATDTTGFGARLLNFFPFSNTATAAPAAAAEAQPATNLQV